MQKYVSFLIIIFTIPFFAMSMIQEDKLRKDSDTSKINEELIEEDIIKTNKVIGPEKKAIAITFDDGPSKYTNRVRDILKKYNVNATFFMLGSNLNSSYTNTLKNLISDGNEIGSHAYSHKMLTKVSRKKLDYEINYTRELLTNMTGTDIVLTRPPYGSINKYIRSNFNSPYILWSIDTKDWKHKDANRIYEYVMERVSDGDIILLHETYISSVEALNLLIPKLLEEGYQILTVSELANLKGVTLENNKVYHSFK